MSIPLLLVFALVFNVPGGLSDSTKPDFTGIWNAGVLQPAATSLKTLTISYTNPKLKRPRNRVVSLIVEHHDPEIKVTRRVVSETQDETETSVYYTDGRGETNVKNGRSTKSVTKWKGNNVVFELSSTSSIGGDDFDFKQTRKWQLAKDGKSLIEVTQQNPSSNKGIIIPGTKTITLVYARSLKPLP